MFGLSGTEILVIALAAVLVFGPSRIPGIARALKAAYREFVRVRSKVDETLASLRQEIDLNLDPPEHTVPLAHTAASPAAPAAKDAWGHAAQVLPVPEADDYLAPGTAPPAGQPYTTDDYLREAGHGR